VHGTVTPIGGIEMTQEQKVRIEIDKRLTESGWLLQDRKEFNPAAAVT
jgi:hypothetical protein